MLSERTSKKITPQKSARSLSLPPSLPLSNLCIALLTCFWHIRQNYKLSSDVCEKGILTGRARASAPARALSTQRFAFQLAHISYKGINTECLTSFIAYICFVDILRVFSHIVRFKRTKPSSLKVNQKGNQPNVTSVLLVFTI